MEKQLSSLRYYWTHRYWFLIRRPLNTVADILGVSDYQRRIKAYAKAQAQAK